MVEEPVLGVELDLETSNRPVEYDANTGNIMVSRYELEYAIRLGVTILFFVFGCLILWAFVSYYGYLPEFGLAARLLNELLRFFGSKMGVFRALLLLLFLSIIGIVNGLLVFASIIYRARNRRLS